MRSYLLLLCLLGLCLTTEARQAESIYAPASVPNVQAADSTRLLSDPNDYIPADHERQINRALLNIRSRYGIEFAIVLIPSIGEQDIESFSTELFRLWGLGDKSSNNGLLLVLAMEQNLSRFEVGYGLEGSITDATSSQVWRHYMMPEFRRGAYAAGLIAGVSAIEQVLEQSEWRAAGSQRSSAEEWELSSFLWMWLIFGGAISLFSFIIAYSEFSKVRTPDQARLQKLRLYDTARSTSLLLLLTCPPMGLIFFVWQLAARRRISRLAKSCARCSSNRVFLAPQWDVNQHLTPYQRIEQRIRSRRFVCYRCETCAHTSVVGEVIPNSGYELCKQCASIAVGKSSPKRMRSEAGRKVIRSEYKCLCCGDSYHKDEADNSDALVAATALSLLGGLSRRSGGSFGGGFGSGAGSFGGGSSGGGGFTGRW